MGQERPQRERDRRAKRSDPQTEREHGNSQARLSQEPVQAREPRVVEISESPLLTENVDRLAGRAAGAQRQSSLEGRAAALRADDQPIESLDGENDRGEYDTIDDPEVAHCSDSQVPRRVE